MTRPLPSETTCQAKAPEKEATTSSAPRPQNLYIETPCIPSPALSRVAGCNIFLKLENLQPSGSFKSRGIGTMMYRAMLLASSSSGPGSPSSPGSSDSSDVHFYCSSGGNAGLAAVAAAAQLGRPCTVVVPAPTPARVVARLRRRGAAAVHQVGADWAAADAHLRSALLARDPRGVYVPPFDHADIWDGVSTLVDELVLCGVSSSSSSSSQSIDAIVCSVGGGGLLNGIMEGVARNFPTGSSSSQVVPTVLALETRGAHSLAAAVAARELVTLPAIDSVATSLGARRVSARSLEWALGSPPGRLAHAVVDDAAAARAAARFADDERMLVEAACGATLAAAYEDGGRLLREALGFGDAAAAAAAAAGPERREEEEWRAKNVVLVVCGGNNVSLEVLAGYVEKYGVGVGGED
ncbi:tryptophan synthase beta subunit-like PLP-dependent enzyme [Biscogniauxia mediterranea]|nr:tryptophan synthase beta subunit-like PLP-dependent enzyme [Biscogniauxia mediterranea]